MPLQVGCVLGVGAETGEYLSGPVNECVVEKKLELKEHRN